MNKPISFAVGKVWSQAKVVTPENGTKPFVDLTLKMATRQYNGKTYMQKVYVRGYGERNLGLVSQLTPDALVTVSGETDAVTEQGKDGKNYANVRIVGNIAVASDGGAAPSVPSTTRTASSSANGDDGEPF